MKKIKKLILLGLLCVISIGASAEEIPNNEIWYTSSNGKVVTPHKSDVFGASIVSNTYSNGKGIIKFNGNVTEIGSHAFEYCSGLTSVTIPNSVTSIGDYAFYGCSGLTSVTIPNSMTSIGYEAFYGCTGLTSVTIPNSVTEIGNAAFSGCSGLTSVTIPNSVTEIGNAAFSGCSGLTSVTIPNSVTSIGDYAFYGCSGLTSVTIPNSVTSIGESAFQNCSGLTSVTIPNSVTDIGSYAFSGCTSLPVIDNVRYADTYLIGAVDKNLSTHKIKEGTKWIGSHAFYGCSGLTSVTIPNSVTSIGSWAFDGCTSLPVENNLRYADTYLVEAVDKTLSTYNIKEGTIWIGSGAFSNCSGLTSVTIPNSVTEIGNAAFSGCSGLTSVTIPNSVTEIGSWAFSGCSSLISVTIPNSVTSIDGYAFSGCTSLPVIDNVRYADTYLIEAVDKNLSTYKIKEGTKWIGSHAFEYCSGLTSVTIPNSVTSIGERAFYGCSGLTSVTIPNSVTSIGESAFKGESLYNIEVHWIEPIVINENTFSNYNATLKVPMVSLSKYQSAEVWKKFKNIKGINTSVVKCIDRTQTTVSLMITDDNIDVYEEIGVEYDNKYYKANADGIITIRNLHEGSSFWVYSYVKYGGEYYVSEWNEWFSTKSLNPEIAVSDVMANKAFVRGVYDIGDAHIYKTTFKVYSKYDNYEIKEQEYKNDKFALTKLAPNTEYMITYYVYYHYGEGDTKSSYTSITKNLTTAQLKMKTLNPKNVSSKSSVVAAEANISDDETGVGFEWRKYDAPESLPSSRGSAIVYDGRMEGKINNLQPVYYNVRPYYESASGKMFYGDWITFDPTDFSYFEPTVHTYDFIDNPTTNSVEVRGYVMQGTDAVTEQGFEYWKTGKASKSKAAGNDVMRIQASGQMMIATLKDLDFESNYIVRAYVTTASGTIYGEERSFTTPKATPEETLGDANLDGSINVNDITTIAKFILEGKVSPWSEVNADANEDGTINVNDITKTAEIILLRAKAEMEAAQRKK